MTSTSRRAGLGLSFIILAIVLAGTASAIEIKLGSVRDDTLKWLMDSRQLSRAAAEQMIRRYERRNRTTIIDSVALPPMAIADYVTIDASQAGPPKVEDHGCGLMLDPRSDEGRELQELLKRLRGTGSYNYLRSRIREAYEKGYFNWKLTPQQKKQLLEISLHPRRDGARVVPTPVRVLVVGTRTPQWDDYTPRYNEPWPYVRSHGHPLNLTPGYNNAEAGRTIGGRWGNGERQGMSLQWSDIGQAGPHPEVLGQTYPTNTEFLNHWFTFAFDTTNPNSLANYWRQNSHGRISLPGNRSDISAWMDSHHILDVTPVGNPHDYTALPGTPMIRPTALADPNDDHDYILRASCTTDQFSMLFEDKMEDIGYDGRLSAGLFGSYQFYFPGNADPANPDQPPYWLVPDNTYLDPDDTRHVTFTGCHFQYFDGTNWTDHSVADGDPWAVDFTDWGATTHSWSGGYFGYTTDANLVSRGCGGLPDTVAGGLLGTTIDVSELLSSRIGNRLLSFCYYNHDHVGDIGLTRPYQLTHLENAGQFVDDIMGDQEPENRRISRPAPYDHDVYDDANGLTGGFFNNTPGHSSGAWKGACRAILADNGINTGAYSIILFTWPNPPPGNSYFISNGGGGEVVIPENAGLHLTAHEMGHCFGLPDLYDTDFYYNAGGGTPPHFESVAMDPYSVMGHDLGGQRLDAWCKMIAGPNGPWLTPQLLGVESPPGSGLYAPQDKLDAPVPEIEGILENPVVYRALPDLATGNLTNGAEYFLVENRNRNGAAYFGDASPRGLYIYHIDERFGQDDDTHFTVIIEQADGLYELEKNQDSDGPGNMAGDPFPAGALNVRSLTQWGDPNTRSHGLETTPGSGVIQPGSSFDTFFRADQISDASANMQADLYVQPRELIVTGTNYAPPTAPQGELNVPILGLALDNNSVAPNISTGDVVVRQITVDETGSSKTDGDTTRALLYEDINGDGVIVPGTDVLLKTATVANQQATFGNLSFRVALSSVRNLLVAYDVSEHAQTSPPITLGAGLDTPQYMQTQIPGAIQERDRLTGAYRFPTRSDDDKVIIIEKPDTLTLTPTNVAPASALQGTLDQEMLGLQLHVNQDSVILDSLRIDAGGTSTRAGDIQAKLYDDRNLNNVYDAGIDVLVDSATFVQNGSMISATFDDLKSYTVDDTADRGLLVAYDFAADATVGETVSVVLVDASYVQLRQAPQPPQDVVASTNFPMGSSETLIVKNTRPKLQDVFGGTRRWLSPTQGNPISGPPSTLWTWRAVYTDAENDPPTPIQVWLDGQANDMWPENPTDTKYSDGAIFRYETQLPVGNHYYYMFCSDGNTDRRFPKTAPDTYPEPVVVNTPPVLSITGAGVNPFRGPSGATYTYTVTFTDADGHQAAFVEVRVDGGGWLTMTEVDPTDLNTFDGKDYQYVLTTPLAPGAHKFDFRANDGYDTVQYPTTGSLTGPLIFSVASGFFAEATFKTTNDPYEEGLPVYIQIKDIDQNASSTVQDTITCTVTVTTGGDTEIITLTETGPDTGVFRSPTAGIPTLGSAGASGDGVINVVAGPTGNTLTLNYTDPYDATDIVTDQAGVRDTIAPAAIAANQITAACDPAGTTVHVDWSAYPEVNLTTTPKQVDVDHYNVFYATSPKPIRRLTPVATVPAGTQTTDILTGGPDGDKYVAVAVYDEVPNVDATVNWVLVNTADREPPVLTAPSPADGQTDVVLDSPISFLVDDGNGSGVQKSDIKVELKQSPADHGTWHDITSDCVITGTARSRRVDYQAPIPFLYNQRVTVRVTATDIAGNTMVASFEFLTITDTAAPTIANRNPDDGATNVPVNTNIAFDLLDNRSGIDPTSIHVTVQGTDVSSALAVSGTPTQTNVLYDPPTDFLYGEVVVVTVDVRDIAGNVMPTVTYSFTTLADTTGPVIDSLNPADGATNVPIDTTISFRVQDAISGVARDSITLSVMGTPVTLTARNFQEIAPNAYLVTYDPGPLPYDTSIACEASARDIAGAPKTTVPWSFRTEPEPTYSVTGTVTSRPASPAVHAGAGVAGVTINVYEVSSGDLVRTVQTAGTGVYEVLNLLAGRYRVVPSLTGYSFDPDHRNVYVGPRDMDGDGQPDFDASDVNFEAIQALYTISGQVSEGGVGLAGVQVSDGTRTAITTAPDGAYTITNVPAGTYTITTTLTNYTFNPTSRSATVPTGSGDGNATGIDFTAQARTFTVSGTVSDGAGNRLSGVEVRVQGEPGVAITSPAGAYTLTGVKAGTRTFVASRTGYEFPPVTEDVQSDLTGVNFIGYSLISHSFSAGRHFVGLPAAPEFSDPATVFGTTQVARWSPTAVPPRYLWASTDRTDPTMAVKAGAGFFVTFAADTNLEVAGTAVPSTDPYPFVIENGWTMAANPFATALPFSNLVPASAGSMSPYGFVLMDGAYVLVSNEPALGGRRWVDGWEGVWLQGNMASATITAMPPGVTSAAVNDETVRRTVDRDNWLVPIVARAAGRVDASNAVGVSAQRGALRVPNPPTMPDSVDVVLQGRNGEPLAYDVRQRIGTGAVWSFRAVTSLADTNVELSLPDLSEVPNDLTVTLVDLAAGKRFYARTMSSLVYNSGQGGARAFRLEIAPRQTAGLSIRPAGAQVGRQGATIAYVLSHDARVTARILNPAGRTLRTIEQRGLSGMGTNTLIWDLTSDAHTVVPNGQYMIVLEAATPGGERSRAMQSIAVAR